MRSLVWVAFLVIFGAVLTVEALPKHKQVKAKSMSFRAEMLDSSESEAGKGHKGCDVGIEAIFAEKAKWLCNPNYFNPRWVAQEEYNDKNHPAWGSGSWSKFCCTDCKVDPTDPKAFRCVGCDKESFLTGGSHKCGDAKKFKCCMNARIQAVFEAKKESDVIHVKEAINDALRLNLAQKEFTEAVAALNRRKPDASGVVATCDRVVHSDNGVVLPTQLHEADYKTDATFKKQRRDQCGSFTNDLKVKWSSITGRVWSDIN
jgi:hypothetical protein